MRDFGGQNVTGTAFSPSTQGFLYHYHSITAPYPYLRICVLLSSEERRNCILKHVAEGNT
jgi:hypothetical protein